MGRNSLLEILRRTPERVEKVFTLAEKGKPSDSRREIQALLSEHGIGVKHLTHSELNSIVESGSHQGYVALLRDRKKLELNNFIEESKNASKSLVLVLDSLTDPQNVGSVIRAAECFGADAVLWSKNRGPGITPVVTKASVGASELVPLIEVANLVDALKKLKRAGFWIVVGEAKGGTDLSTFEFPPKIVLIAGSEGEGVRELTLKNADFVVRIPLSGRIQSLNVSQAVAIMLYRYATTIPPS